MISSMKGEFVIKEKDKIQNKKMFTFTCILAVITLPVVYMTHKAVPFMMDDLWYSTRLFEEVPIRSLKDIWDSQVWHYLNWGGRSITHSILQLCLLSGETAADILNVVVMALLAWMVCVTAQYKNLMAFMGAVCLMIGCNANWKMSMFWQSGAANYLYITLPVLFFLYCYLRYLEADEVKEYPGILWWMIPLGVAAGWSNENMGPAVWLMTLLVILMRKREKKQIRLWMVLGNIACLAGCILVIAAPGNYVRSVEAANEYGWLWNCFLRGYAESKALLDYLFPTILILLCLLVCSKGVLGLKTGKKNICLILTALISWGAMILSPHYPDRAAFGTMILLDCVILSIVKDIVRARKETGWYLWTGMAVLWLRSVYFLGEFLAIGWGWIR